jgi:outer membrane protein assembly factor BamB
LQFDSAPEAVVAGQRIFVPSNTTDSVSAYSTLNGELLWQFQTDGPVRFAPVAHADKVYFVADDGHLYCVDAADGRLHWRINGGPGDRRILGNHRLISTWPARGGPVLHEGRLYFSASIWPFMGIFIHAVDPDSGKILWTNSGDGTNYTVQPHGAPSFAGIVPQGHLAAAGDRLVVPGGRTMPGVYDCGDGRQVAFRYDKKIGHHAVMAGGGSFFCAGHGFLIGNAADSGEPAPALLDDSMLIARDTSTLTAMSTSAAVAEAPKGTRNKRPGNRIKREPLFKQAVRASGRWVLKAGPHIFAADKGKITSYDCSPQASAEPVWQGEVPGTIWNMVAADDRLFVMTTDSQLYCFGGKAAEVVHHVRTPQALPAPTASDQVLIEQAAKAGYAVVLGEAPLSLFGGLLAETKLQLIAVQDEVTALRKHLQAAGVYGTRAAAHAGATHNFPFPPYLAHSIIAADSASGGVGQPGFVGHLFAALRPYGGRAVLALNDAQHARFADAVTAANLQKAELRRVAGLTLLTRVGALPGTDDWTHQYGNPAQTVVSQDKQVKLPLGMLWFGGPPHTGVLPRHGHGPNPQVAGGRLVIEGADMLRAVDVYTGRMMWERALPGIGKYYDNTSHAAGAGEIGSNYVTMPDAIYAIHGRQILELDPDDGHTVKTLELAQFGKPHWGYIGATDDFLVASASPVDLKMEKASPQDLPKAMRPLIPRGSEWEYRIPDGKWTRGKAGFGYGDNDDATVIDMRGKFDRVDIRKEFAGSLVKGMTELSLMVSYDDGFIAYLNGQEIARGQVEGEGEKARAKNHEAGRFERFKISNWRQRIKPGNNVLALTGYNTNLRSSDFSLHPYLVGRPADSATPTVAKPATPPVWKPRETQYATGSRRVCVFDRHSGELLWTREAVLNFRHNNFCLTDDTVFCLDSMTPPKRAGLSLKGVVFSGPATLYALDARTGAVRWQNSDNTFGTFLSYSAEHDILLQAGSAYRDRAKDENTKGMAAFRGSDGELLWRSDMSYGGPCMLWKDKIITNGGGGLALDIQTGEPTGWRYSRNYGCNTAIGSEHLLTFRSGAAGFYDLTSRSGTGNFGGFRASCTSNLIVANGVLNAPDYTRTCSCAYQNQTSLALVHMPTEEFWAEGATLDGQRFGINFGAPGDRRSAAGSLWLDYPSVGGKSPQIKLQLVGDELSYHRQHTSAITGELPWVRASGVTGVKQIRLTIPESARAERYTLRLISGGDEAAFDVTLAGQTTASAREIHGVTAPDGILEFALAPRVGTASLLSGLEVVGE